MSRKIISLFLALLMVFSMTAAMAESAAVTVTDMFGREITLDEPASRIVVMEPSDCEILYALGGGDKVVARGLYCDYPAEVLELPVLQSGENTNIEEILALNPQVVLMSDMAHAKEQVTMLENNGVKVVVSNADSIQGVYTSIRMIGTLMGKETEAEAMIADMQAAFEGIAAKCTAGDKTIYFEVMPLEWGLWSAGKGTFMQEMAEMCGMQNAFDDIDGWQPISEEQVIQRNPDYIVLVTGMGETAVSEVMNRAGWGDIEAVKNGKVYNADSYTMTRPGPRLKEAAVSLYNFLYDIAE